MKLEQPQQRRVVMTAALPYSNGPIHIGHLVEYVQADAKARYLRQTNSDVLFVCADDNHGTAIEMKATELGETPEALVERIGREHQRDFAKYNISFDNYHQTHSIENREICEHIYARLKDAGHIVQKDIEQLYDPVAGRFLADRHVSGSCPKCGALEQFGDLCEVCGATYAATELKEPLSRLSGSVPEIRNSEHFFFSLAPFEAFLKEWTNSGALQAPVKAKLEEWFKSGLKDWDISRDAPYFGFEIPDAPGKYFYVWLDAPVGYLASLENYCSKNKGSWRDYWAKTSTHELHHFIGKDIANFHVCFWPCLLKGAGYRTPTKVFCHGFLTVDGRKMSKSKGTFITAERFAKHVEPDALRYYLLSLLNGGIEDINLNLEDFADKVNADLVGKIVNIAARCAPMLQKTAGNVLANELEDPLSYQQLLSEAELIAADFEKHDTASAIRRIVTLANNTNKYIDKCAPWKRADDPKYVRLVVSQALFHFRAISIMMQPVTPDLAKQSLAIISEPDCKLVPWTAMSDIPFGRSIKNFETLFVRVDQSAVEAVISKSTSLVS